MVLTHGNHALAVVVQVLLDNLQQALDGPPCLVVPEPVALALAEILILLLHLGKGGGEVPHHALVGSLVDIGLDEDAKVEDELVAEILGVGDDDGVAEHGVLAVGRVDGYVAVAKGLAGDDVFVEDVKVDEGLACGEGCLGGGDASGRRLGDDFGAYGWLSA